MDKKSIVISALANRKKKPVNEEAGESAAFEKKEDESSEAPLKTVPKTGKGGSKKKPTTPPFWQSVKRGA